MSELVTGEAVVLDMRLARPATRALALGIDLAIELVCFLLLLIPVALVTGQASESLVTGLLIACSLVTFVGYTTTIETLTRGKSVGKYALGLRVVRDDGGPVQFRQAFVRALCGVFVDFFVTSGCVGFLTAMLNARGKRVGDMLAGTLVLRERGPGAAAPLPDVPVELATWASGAELSRVPDQLALSVRSYLTRYHDLSPSARDALGGRLAEAVAEYVSPPPPPGVPAWAYLTAVLGERRRRAFGQHSQQLGQGSQHGQYSQYSQPGQPPGPWPGRPAWPAGGPGTSAAASQLAPAGHAQAPTSGQGPDRAPTPGEPPAPPSGDDSQTSSDPPGFAPPS